MSLKTIHLCLECLREVCYRMQALGQWASLLRINVNVYRQRAQYTGSELAQIPNLLTLSLQNVSLKKMKRPMHPTRTYYIPISQLGISISNFFRIAKSENSDVYQLTNGWTKCSTYPSLLFNHRKEYSTNTCYNWPPRRLSGKESPAKQETGFKSRVGKIPWRRKGQPTPEFLSGKSPGQSSLAD